MPSFYAQSQPLVELSVPSRYVLICRCLVQCRHAAEQTAVPLDTAEMQCSLDGRKVKPEINIGVFSP